MKRIFLYASIMLLASPPLASFAQPSTDYLKPSNTRISLHNEKNVAIGWDFVYGIVEGKIDKVSQVFAPDFMSYGPGADDVENTEQYFAIWKERYVGQSQRKIDPISGISLEVMSGNLKGEWVMLWFDYTANFDGQNKTIKVPTQLTFKLDNGKISELHEYFDTGSILRKLGQVK